MQDVVATTPTQYAFAICLLNVAPVLAIFGELREWMRRLDAQNRADPTRYGVPHDYVEHACGPGTFHSWCS